MLRNCIKVAGLVFLLPCMTAAATTHLDDTKPTSADYLRWSKDPVDGGWLPDLTGLPDKAEVDRLTNNVVDVMTDDDDKQCKAISWNLRLMMFQHFAIYQHMLNAQGTYLDKKSAHHWAHVLAMVLKESSGDAANITDMKGHTKTTYRSKATLDQWKYILKLTKSTRIKMDYQTNFGLTQTSVDRLFNEFRLARDQASHASFLIGKKGANSLKQTRLNTAIVIRRIIWFYQDFSQGRLTQNDARIHKRDLKKPEFAAKVKPALQMVIMYCGTDLMYKNKEEESKQQAKLREAMASIAYCKIGNAKKGYGKNEFNEKCFAQWVTLCPALNIDIARLTPLSYFQTRKAHPVCESTFRKLLTKKSEPKS